MEISKYFVSFFQGMVMGVAEGVPGVSGSTLALLMGIYEKFIGLLSSVTNHKKWKKIDFGFALPLGLGTVTSLLLFARVLDYGLENYPMYVYAIFFGLTLVSLRIPFHEIKGRETGWFLVILTLLTALLVFQWLPMIINASNGFTPIYLFAGGFLAVSGLIFPGVSGSFVLVILGLYQYIYVDTFKNISGALSSPDRLFDLAIFILGMVVGFVVMVKVVHRALDKHRPQVMAVIMGVMLASLQVLWPFMQAVEGVKVFSYPKLAPWEVGGGELLLVVLFTLVGVFIGWGIYNYSPLTFSKK